MTISERIAAATGPNYALEVEIADAVWLAQWGRKRPKDIKPAACTASVDAAMTLIPADHYWAIVMISVTRGGFSACCQAKGTAMNWTNAATPALALTAAALKARGL